MLEFLQTSRCHVTNFINCVLSGLDIIRFQFLMEKKNQQNKLTRGKNRLCQ